MYTLKCTYEVPNINVFYLICLPIQNLNIEVRLDIPYVFIT